MERLRERDPPQRTSLGCFAQGGPHPYQSSITKPPSVYDLLCLIAAILDILPCLLACYSTCRWLLVSSISISFSISILIPHHTFPPPSQHPHFISSIRSTHHRRCIIASRNDTSHNNTQTSHPGTACLHTHLELTLILYRPKFRGTHCYLPSQQPPFFITPPTHFTTLPSTSP